MDKLSGVETYTKPINIINNKLKNNYGQPATPKYVFELYIYTDVGEKYIIKEEPRSWSKLLKIKDQILLQDIKSYKIIVSEVSETTIEFSTEGTLNNSSHANTNNNIFIEFTSNSLFALCSCVFIKSNSIVSPPY